MEYHCDIITVQNKQGFKGYVGAIVTSVLLRTRSVLRAMLEHL